MSSVSVEIFQSINGSMESRLAQVEARLTELFQNLDTKFVDSTAATHSIELKTTQATEEIKTVKEVITDKSNQIDAIKLEVPQRLADIMLETKNFVSERTTAMESQFQDAQQGLHRLQMQTIELRAEINRIGMSSQQGGGGGGGHKKKSLMDPKNFELKYLDGDKEIKNAIDEWRDDMEEYLNSFFPNLKFFRRCNILPIFERKGAKPVAIPTRLGRAGNEVSKTLVC